MPGGDRRGPDGRGPMTGRATGYCSGYEAPGFANQIGKGGFRCRGGGDGWGRSIGRGRGGGWGRRNRFHATGMTGWQRESMAWPADVPPATKPYGPGVTKEQELDRLKRQAESYERMLNDLRNRIHDAESFQENE